MSYKCPYCLYRFEKDQVEFEEIHEVDYFLCPNPKEENGRRFCNRRLPLDFLDSSSISISLVGGPYVGKTYYFLALLYQLRENTSLAKLGIQGDIVGGKNGNPEIFDLLKKIRRGEKLDATQVKTAVKTVIDISITNDKEVRHIYVSLFDNPGEDFNDINRITNFLPNVSNTDCIIFLIEPKQLKNFRDEVIDKYLYERGKVETDIYTLINNVSRQLNHVKNNTRNNDEGWQNPWLVFKKITKKINKKNIAFTISKFDQISKYFHSEIPFDEKSMEDLVLLNGKLNENYLNSISNEIFDLITDEDDGDLRVKNILKSSSFNYAFFGTKSANVDDNGNVIDMTNPQGVSLPLIWLLRQINLI